MTQINRRSLLLGTAALMGLPHRLAAAPMVLRAAPVSAQILPQGDGSTQMLGFNGTTPGPEIRVRAGETVQVRFENHIGDGSALHWHGIRIDNAMDGVPGLTQPMVQDGSNFDYEFLAPDPGTYWYHSHNRSWEQVARGLYGPLIVEETAPPSVDHDITVILDDWRIERTGEMIEDFGNRHDFSHAGRLGTYARALPSRDVVQRGDRLRLRLINTATARIFPLQISGIEGVVVALDGMPLETPLALDALMLSPAQRVDVIADVQETVKFIFPTRGDPYEMGEIAVSGENPAPLTEKIAPLPPSTLPKPAAPPQHALTLRLQGGAMGGQHDGDDIWALNGVSGLPDVPWQQFKRGDTAEITLINETAFPHGIHLHGHHFYEMGADGTPGALRDTTLLQRQETRRIACVFDNPGKWLLHCHMLGHQAAGMKTWLEVT